MVFPPCHLSSPIIVRATMAAPAAGSHDAPAADPLDALSAALESSAVGLEDRDASRQHPRLRQGRLGGSSKVWLSSRQERRRETILKHQRRKRDDYRMFARCLVTGEDIKDVDGEEEEEKISVDEPEAKEERKENEDEEDCMEIQEARSLGQRPLRRSYSHQLMLSEWFDEVPADFPSAWTVALAPAGKRCLVVAGGGATCQYGRNGGFLYRFPSGLPGGNRAQAEGERGRTTLLDCVYEWATEVFHVLDVMMWGDESYYETDTEER